MPGAPLKSYETTAAPAEVACDSSSALLRVWGLCPPGEIGAVAAPRILHTQKPRIRGDGAPESRGYYCIDREHRLMTSPRSRLSWTTAIDA